MTAVGPGQHHGTVCILVKSPLKISLPLETVKQIIKYSLIRNWLLALAFLVCTFVPQFWYSYTRDEMRHANLLIVHLVNIQHPR